MSRPLRKNLAEVARRIRGARQLFLFMDFDGTLAPIVQSQGLARVPSRIRRALLSLRRSRNVRIAVVSGRALADLKQRVGLRGLVYAGNHGLEIGGRGLRFEAPRAAANKSELRRLCRNLAYRLRHTSGAEVEDKRLSASVHFRRVPSALQPEVRRIVRAGVRSAGRGFCLRAGNKVLEIRPCLRWGKGTAARWIRKQLGKNGAVTIYLGDDVTDEDAFSALSKDITVKVGGRAGTAARYYLGSQRDVGEFLAWLGRLVR